MKKYYKYQVEKALQIKNLVTIEYLDMKYGFNYPNESHDFYEFIYIEKGSLTCLRDKEEIELTQNDLLLISPNSNHGYQLSDKQTAKVVIVCFSCKSDILSVHDEKISLSDREKNTVADIIAESRKCFHFPFDKKLVPLTTPRFGAQQLIENFIEQLLISITRKKTDATEIKFVTDKNDFNQSISQDVEELLGANLYDNITLDVVCKNSFYSKTYLNNIFKDTKGYTIMQYYNLLKINEAKKLLKRGESIQNVSNLLCFDSPNYFTKVFKKFAGITPSQFIKE